MTPPPSTSEPTAPTPWWNPQRPSGMPVHRYRRPAAPELTGPPSRTWLDNPPDRAPLWSSVDLRDGNQALANPMDPRRKRAMFDLLVRMGFKDIEIGYPSASEDDFAFVRRLVTGDDLPDDVTITVFTPARPDLIDRTFEAVRGADRAVVHLCHATACLWRDVVFRMTPSDVLALARESALRMVRLADRADGDIRFEYSPETFNVTEPAFALEIANTVAEIVDASPERPLTLNLPSTVETHAPHVFADQIAWMHRNLDRRDGIILSVHPHNDRGTAVAAAEYALAAGADRVEGTLFGNGERTGNVCLVTLALNLLSRGVDPQLDLSDIPAIRAVVEECNEMPVPARHPYAGDLVFTAFSGTHQDAIAKGLAHLEARAAETGTPARDLPWEVPYLPIDPRDIGRGYEPVIRVNSQSGKGGIAHVLRTGWGLDLPAGLRADFAGVIQRVTDVTGAEVAPDRIWDTFRAEYGDIGAWAPFAARDADGGGSDDTDGDPIGALLAAVRARGVRAEADRLVHGEAGPATGAAHACYARVLVEHRPVWGVGLGATAHAAAVRAVLAALHRAGARTDDTAPVPHLAGPREGAR
ncbi:2-isopropylmalate synthase [Streptomyces sp. NPDC003036]|uniref:2-isopropylmalate synthase n=1 Tax=Streptomyces sp. NPDC003036 TaxID=3154442 RepID=UPI0033B927A1